MVDSREKKPISFLPLRTVSAALKVGDYSVKGYEERMAVERKSFSDLYDCLTTKLSFFRGQLKRLSVIPHRSLIIETSMTAFLMGHPMKEITGAVALERLNRLAEAYGISYHFCDRCGPLFVKTLLYHWWKEENHEDWRADS